MRYTKSQVTKALRAADRLLKGPPCAPANIAQVLNRFMDCTEISDAKGEGHDHLKSSIFARMGDAYRREGNVQLAAHWYRRACRISPVAHAATYAHMVCKHQLADFYPDALAALEQLHQRQSAKSLLTRIFIGLGTWAKSGEAREIARNQKRNLEFLRQNTLAKAA